MKNWMQKFEYPVVINFPPMESIPAECGLTEPLMPFSDVIEWTALYGNQPVSSLAHNLPYVPGETKSQERHLQMRSK